MTAKYGRVQSFNSATPWDAIKVSGEFDNLLYSINDAQASASFATSSTYAASSSFANSSSSAVSLQYTDTSATVALTTAVVTPGVHKIPVADANGKFSITSGWFNYFESSEQTITSAGALTLSHGLGVAPVLVQAWLKCKTAELGYSIGDTVRTNDAIDLYGGSTGVGVSIVPDATNLNIRYGNDGNVFGIMNKTTGANAAITKNNWRVIFRAWA